MPERVEPSDKELDLATPDHHRAWPTSGTRAQYHDSFTAELRALIAEKAAGNELVEEPEGAPEEPGQLVDLMAALQASVDAAKRPRGDADDDEDAEDRTA